MCVAGASTETIKRAQMGNDRASIHLCADSIVGALMKLYQAKDVECDSPTSGEAGGLGAVTEHAQVSCAPRKPKPMTVAPFV